MNTPRQHYLNGFLAASGEPRKNRPLARLPSAEPVTPPSPSAETNGNFAHQPESPPPASLSWEEQVKRALFPLDAFPQLLECARTDQPPSAADSFRFQWFGLFYQGPEKDAFTLRLRLPGGRLRGFQLSGLAEITQDLAGGWLELNVQGGIDLPSIPVRGAVEALRRAESVGLGARGAGGDCVQAVRGSYGEGSRPDQKSLVYLMICELEQVLARSREFGDLPGGCEIAFRATDEWPASGKDAAASDETSIVLQAQPPRQPPPAENRGWVFDQGQGAAETWRVLLPGSGDLGVALSAAEVVPVCLALLRVWLQAADRSSRELAALASVCARLGTRRLHELIEREAGRRFGLSAPELVPSPPTHSGGGIDIPGGRLLSQQLMKLARWTSQHECDEIRLVPPGSLFIPRPGDSAWAGQALREILLA